MFPDSLIAAMRYNVRLSCVGLSVSAGLAHCSYTSSAKTITISNGGLMIRKSC